MAKKEFKADVKEWIGPVKESKNNNWCKYVLRVSYNDKPANIDIRNVKFGEDGSHVFGKGISLADDEVDTLVDTLVEKGYGTSDVLERALETKKSIFTKTKIFDETAELVGRAGALKVHCGDK